jgi:hypothetical protein
MACIKIVEYYYQLRDGCRFRGGGGGRHSSSRRRIHRRRLLEYTNQHDHIDNENSQSMTHSC